MKRTWVMPAILVAGLASLGSAAYAASAQEGWRGGLGPMVEEGAADYNWSSQRWRDDDRRGDDDRGPRWRDRDDDRRGYGPRGRGDENCGPRMGRGHGEHGRGRHGGHGYGGRHGMGRGRGMGLDHDGPGHGFGGGPRHGRFGAADPAQLDSVKKELAITPAQEAAWTKYAGAVREAADSARKRREGVNAGAARGLSVEEFRKFRDLLIEQRRKEQDIVRAAVDELIKSLDEKQVAIAREVLPGYAFGPGMRFGMGWGSGRNR
jgi:hypothetical protein